MTEVARSFYSFKIILEYGMDNQFSNDELEITENQSKMLYTMNMYRWNVSKP